MSILIEGAHRHRMFSGTEKTEVRGTVEEGDIDAARVIAVGDNIAIPHRAQGRASGKVDKNRVVLHFAKPHQRGSVIPAYGGYHLSQPTLLLPITRERPMPFSLGKVLHVILQAVVSAVKQIFCVVESNTESKRLPLCHRGQKEPKTRQKYQRYSLYTIHFY